MRRIIRNIKQFARQTGISDGYSLLELVLVIMLMTTSVPAIISMYTTVMANSHHAEYMTIADLLAIEQMEIILADYAGTSYGAINAGHYSSVDPDPPFDSFSRTVSFNLVNPGGTYEYKEITVTVGHAMIPDISIVMALFDHPGI